MTEDDRQRVREAHERTMGRASAFFASLDSEQTEKLEARAEELQAKSSPPVDHEKIGRHYEQAGWIAKADYLEMVRVIQAFEAGDRVGDDDLDAMLRLLAGSGEAIIRTRVLTLLARMVKRDRASPDRTVRIEAGIARFRTGPDDLDVLSWAQVRRASTTMTRQASRSVEGRLHLTFGRLPLWSPPSSGYDAIRPGPQGGAVTGPP
jgi:hypothetical protein